MKLAKSRSVQVALLLVTLLIAAVLPHVVPRLWTNVVTTIMMTSIGGIALTLVIGVAGQISVGSAAFMAVGAVTAASLSAVMDAPLLLTVAVAGVVGALAGLVAGAPAARLTGLYLAISTLAFHFVTVFAIESYQVNQVGYSGWRLAPVSMVGGLRSHIGWFYILGIFFVLTILIARALVRSNVGRMWFAMKGHPTMAASFGVNLTSQKLAAFALTSAIIAMEGALSASRVTLVQIETYSLHHSLIYLVIIFVGGIGSISGAILGSVFVVGVPYFVRWLAEVIGVVVPVASGWVARNTFALESMIYGFSILAVFLIKPGGLIDIVSSAKRRLMRTHASTPAELGK